GTPPARSAHPRAADPVHRGTGAERDHGLSHRDRAALAHRRAGRRPGCAAVGPWRADALAADRARRGDRHQPGVSVPGVRHGLARVRAPGDRGAVRGAAARSGAQRVGGAVGDDRVRGGGAARPHRGAGARDPVLLAAGGRVVRGDRDRAAVGVPARHPPAGAAPGGGL
ncbi:MAG: hypothetical protein AVDCRST_MAG89-4262, partial [uncultured Gemmatimonadetes bacterium]